MRNYKGFLKGSVINSLKELFDHIEWESNRTYVDDKFCFSDDFDGYQVRELRGLIAQGRIFKAEINLE